MACDSIPVDRYRSPLSQMMATIVALVSLAERRRAAETAPPEEGPAKMPSTRARALMVPSASL